VIRFRSSIIAVASLFIPCLVLAAPSVHSVHGLLNLGNGHTLFVDFAPAQAGSPTVVLFNGLTNQVSDFDQFASQLQSQGLGAVRFDFMGQGETLIAAGGSTGIFTVESQVADAHALLEKLGVSSPVHLIGFSYGGGIAQAYSAKFPEQISSLILMSPFTASIESQDSYIRWQVSAHRLMFPFDARSYDEIYDSYLRSFIFLTYPAADPRLLENPYRLEAVFHLVQGIRHFRSTDVMSSLPKGKLHLMIGAIDELIPAGMSRDFWSALPDDVKASRLTITGCGHRIPELVPTLAANWVKRIIARDPKLSGGHSYVVNGYIPSSQIETDAK
jgi:pimeloyl-ACP methyl ester carboxylesterase